MFSHYRYLAGRLEGSVLDKFQVALCAMRSGHTPEFLLIGSRPIVRRIAPVAY